MLRWEPMGTICRWIPPTLIPFDTQSSICQDMSRYSYESPLRTSTSGFYLKIQYHTVPYSTIEYHRVPPKIPTRKICKSSNDVLRFFPNEHIAISNSATVASRPSRPSRPCLGSRKISWIFGSNLWIVYRNEPQNSMNFRCSCPAKNSGKNQCDISTGNMFTFQANRITGVITSNSRSHWWSRDLLCVPDGDKAGDKEGDSVQPGVIWPSKSVYHKVCIIPFG